MKWLALLCPFAACIAAPPPHLFSVATGAFDFHKEKWRTWEFALEYKAYVSALAVGQYLTVRPVIGAMATVEGTFYGYGGINFDLLFLDHLHFSPGFAAGYYAAGQGKPLGYPLEFRSGVELGWRFSDWSRVGIHFYHLSNAHLGPKNPGEESLVFFYDIPIRKNFPFCN